MKKGWAVQFCFKRCQGRHRAELQRAAQLTGSGKEHLHKIQCVCVFFRASQVTLKCIRTGEACPWKQMGYDLQAQASPPCPLTKSEGEWWEWKLACLQVCYGRQRMPVCVNTRFWLCLLLVNCTFCSHGHRLLPCYKHSEPCSLCKKSLTMLSFDFCIWYLTVCRWQSVSLDTCFLEPQVKSLSPLLCLPGEEPVFVASGKWHNLRVVPEKGTHETLQSILYLEKPGRGSPRIGMDFTACWFTVT